MIDPIESTPPKRRLGLYVFGVIVLLAAGWGAYRYVNASNTNLTDARKAIEAEAALGPRVLVATVAKGPSTRTITLLGDAKPYLSAMLFAKVSGYLKSVEVDKGQNVTAGQKIAEIESPELESQYQGAVADLDYKRRLADRSRELYRTGSTSQQTAEQNESGLRVAEETVNNLNTMRSYQVLTAPFAGTIVARFADPGALMQAATTNQSTSLPVVQIADNSRLRIGAYVEQRDVALIHVGDPVEIVDASNADRRRPAVISRTAATLDPRTRTLFIEIELDNHDGFLVPGSFTYANVTVAVPSYPQIPVAALSQRGGKSQVAVLGEDGVVQFRDIKIGNTDGTVINILDGVQAGEKVVLNVPNEVTSGARVRPTAAR